MPTLKQIADAKRSPVGPQMTAQSKGPMMRNPTPDWLKPENDSVFDSATEKAMKAFLRLIGADDPNSQALGIAAPLDMPAGTLRSIAEAAGRIPMTKAAAARAPLEALAESPWHPIGNGKKLEVPLSEMTFGVTPAAGARTHRPLDPEALLNAKIIPLTGDRARAQATLTRVGDVPLRNPVSLPGGPDFMLEKPGSAWASAAAPIEKLAKKVRAPGGDGRTFGIYVPGSHAMVDFSTTFADALLEQVAQSPVTKKGLRNFDAQVRRLRPEWKGLAHPEARAQLDANGELRLAFTDVMGLNEFRQAGFPDLATTRAAISEPGVMNTPSYHGGYAIAELDPGGNVIRQPASPHPSYNTELGGQYVGQFSSDVPIADLFPTFTRARRRAGADPARDIRSFMLSNPTQIATPAWVERVSTILAKSPPRVVNYVKKYGVAGALAAGAITEAQARQLSDGGE